MSVSSPMPPQRNSLHSLASVGGVLLGTFLLAGAFGHIVSVWPAPEAGLNELSVPPLSLLLPGLLLALSGLINVFLCKALWGGAKWALQLALGVNLAATIYLGYLLNLGVPGHPIGLFLALVSSYVVLLAAIRLGLIWPARDQYLDSP